jgi:hypothetical protein
MAYFRAELKSRAEWMLGVMSAVYWVSVFWIRILMSSQRDWVIGALVET